MRFSRLLAIAALSVSDAFAAEGWKTELVAFVEASRGSYGEIREARKHCTQERGRQLLRAYIENARAPNMLIHNNYIRAIQLDK